MAVILERQIERQREKERENKRKERNKSLKKVMIATFERKRGIERKSDREEIEIKICRDG